MPHPALVIAQAGPEDLPAVREMLREYAAWIGVDLSYQGFEQELAGLPGDYAPPQGALLVARQDALVAGMVALRRLDDERCEMKRLYVRPAARRGGVGRALAERVILEASERGYASIVLDTLPVMSRAQSMYVALGFRDIAPYYSSPVAGTRYMALPL